MLFTNFRIARSMRTEWNQYKHIEIMLGVSKDKKLYSKVTQLWFVWEEYLEIRHAKRYDLWDYVRQNAHWADKLSVCKKPLSYEDLLKRNITIMNKVTLVIVWYLLIFDKYIFIFNICYTHHWKIVSKIHLIEKSDLNRQYFVWWYLWLLRWETHFHLILH